MDQFWIDQYREWYNRGWRYSHSESASLDWADSRHFPKAWYDGYMDYAVGREKWQGPEGPRI